MKSRRVTTIILIITIFFSVILFNYDNPINQERESIENYKTNNGTVKAPLIYGLSESNALTVLDPVDSGDSEANDVIRHVCDNLWTYNLSSGNYEIENMLAVEDPTWNAAEDELTVILRENVWFHDGTKFNATAVKFTFDRILYFINATGTLPDTTHTADPASLFLDMRGNSILNKTAINSEYNVTFILNKPNALFEQLLTYDACVILHPASTPATIYLELGTDTLVGTGPFVYEGYTPGVQIGFHAYENYWGGKADIEEIIFKYYPDSITASCALLNGDCHFLKNPPTSMIATFNTDPEIVFLNMNTSFIYSYWGLNNRKINDSNLRKAIAYAYNYTYFIEVVRLGYAIRAHQFLPPGFPYYNASFRAPYYDTHIARQAMLLAAAADGKDVSGLTAQPVGESSTNDAAWSAKTFYTFKILEHEEWTTGIEMNIAFANDMDAIGISIVPDVMDWESYVYTTTHNPDLLEIFYDGHDPDYLDPFNMIEPLLSNMSSANHIQLQDSQIMQWLTEYEEELNPSVKGELSYKIQQRAINEIYAELPVSYDMVIYVHHKNLTGFPYNLMNHLYFYPCNGSFTAPAPDYLPTSNHPEDLFTTFEGLETINWILYDDFGGGQYRVWANDINGNFYIWVDWTPWTNNTPLNVPINRTVPGVYNYTIEYYDSTNQFGVQDTVIVTLTDMIPKSNHPENLFTTLGGSETIDWILYDDFGGGQYRVWANDTNGNYYVWVDWTPWTNNIPLNVPINRTSMGFFNYTIEYYDSSNQFGVQDTVIMTITDIFPSSNHPIDFLTSLKGSETIDWILYDDFGGGQYRVWANDTNGNFYIWVDWTPWTNNTSLNVPINRTSMGFFNYTIEYYDSSNQFGIPDIVIVTITDMIPSSNHPIDFLTSLKGSETIDWILYDDFGEGQYRVWANDINDNYYIWVDWTPWTNNTPLNVPINRTSMGFYNYTIEYYDNNTQFGKPDMVIVAITETEEAPSFIPGPNVMLISMISLLAIVILVNNILRKRDGYI